MKLGLSGGRLIEVTMCLGIAYNNVYSNISSMQSQDLAQAVEVNVSQYHYVSLFLLLNYSGH